jgi:hypothetical protein
VKVRPGRRWTPLVVALLGAAALVTGVIALKPGAGSRPRPAATPALAPSATPTPTPTQSPSPTAAPLAPMKGFPDASDTGVPPGTELTAYTGENPITTANAVIDGKILHGEILVDAPGVTIRDSRIDGTVHVDDDTDNSLLLQSVEIDCGGHDTGVGEANVTVRRANIHGCENGFDMNQNMDVRDSYIHGLPLVGHDDGMQFAYGHFEDGKIVDGSKDLTIVHNTIFSTNEQGTGFGTSAIISNKGGDTNVLIKDNLLAGGAYTIYCEGGGKGTDYRVLDNHFSTRFKASIGYYGVSAECGDETQSGNVVAETGRPLHLGG